MVKTTHKRPIVITDGFAEDFLEQDCACVTNASLVRKQNSTFGVSKDATQLVYPLGDFRISDNLFFQKINGGFEVVFDLDGLSGLSVLNESAKEILIKFDQEFQVREDTFSSFEEIRTFTTLVNLGLIKDSQPYEEKLVHKRQLTAWLHLSDICNLNCSYCYISQKKSMMGWEIGKQSIDAIFRSAKQHDFKSIKLKYAGGEPTLNFENLVRLHTYARMISGEDFELDGVVLTNAVGITQSMISTIKKLGLRVAVSLDGVGKFNDSQRVFHDGQGTFSEIEHSLNLLKDADIPTSISVTITNRNVQGLYDTVEYLYGKDLPFNLNFYRVNKNGNQGLVADQQCLIRELKKAIQILSKKEWPYSVLNSFMDRVNLNGRHERSCGVADSYMVIDGQGSISKCHMVMDDPLTSIKSYDPLEVIRSDENQIQNVSVLNKPQCRNCPLANFCAGGCPYSAKLETGSYFSSSPYCDVYLAIFPNVLALEGERLLIQNGLK